MTGGCPDQLGRDLSAPRPTVQVLDARPARLDESELKAWSRAMSARSAAAHVSRSYAYPYALVACHCDPVGVDIELVQPLAFGFLASIQTPWERGAAVPGEGGDRDTWATSLWSGKEALAKALGDALRYDPRRLQSPVTWPDSRCGRWRAEAVDGIDGHVGWVCWAAAGRAGAGG